MPAVLQVPTDGISQAYSYSVAVFIRNVQMSSFLPQVQTFISKTIMLSPHSQFILIIPVFYLHEGISTHSSLPRMVTMRNKLLQRCFSEHYKLISSSLGSTLTCPPYSHDVHFLVPSLTLASHSSLFNPLP